MGMGAEDQQRQDDHRRLPQTGAHHRSGAGVPAGFEEHLPAMGQVNDFQIFPLDSYRMPGGIRSDDDFWRLLSEREIVQEPVTDRYGRGAQPIGGFSGPERVASPYEGLIRDGDEWLFDNKLFGISRKEASQLDPLARMLLTCAHETLGRRKEEGGKFSWRPGSGMEEVLAGEQERGRGIARMLPDIGKRWPNGLS